MCAEEGLAIFMNKLSCCLCTVHVYVHYSTVRVQNSTVHWSVHDTSTVYSFPVDCSYVIRSQQNSAQFLYSTLHICGLFGYSILRHCVLCCTILVSLLCNVRTRRLVQLTAAARRDAMFEHWHWTMYVQSVHFNSVSTVYSTRQESVQREARTSIPGHQHSN